MGETIDVHLFIDIIISEGAIRIFADEVDGEFIEWYIARAKKVEICVTDEFMSKQTATDLLRQLGLDDLIDRIF